MSRKKGGLKLDLKKGAYHRVLGLKPDEPIPMSITNKILEADIGDVITFRGKKIKVTALLKRRANFHKVSASWSKGRK